MPHSNDRTLVTCAGDTQVRVFDIEYSSTNGNAESTSGAGTSVRSQRINDFFGGTRYLSEGNTNARVYRSHADRVKRIVTESSPYLFLTCSEDGEVRQWDLRQPSSAYPPPRGGVGLMAYRPGVEHDDSNVPPPLISYKRHRLDLNTISCSPSQPHYIALGGAHLHCFLHDRRMLGRDLLAEKGTPPASRSSSSSRDDDSIAGATRCVRRFAPRGKRRMSNHDSGHITACKISDANPNEMVVSWSGDHIYSFDLIRSPDAREEEQTSEKSVQESSESRRRQSSRNRKRKRQKGPASSSSESSGSRRQSRRRSEEGEDDGEFAFRVRYGNGESEDIPFPSLTETITDSPGDLLERARYSELNDAQRLSDHVARGLVKLRKALFSLESYVRETAEASWEGDLTPYTTVFSSALAMASTYLPQMDQIMRSWRYPMNPTPDVVRFQHSLRRNRESAWRFVQAAGTLSSVLRGENHLEETYSVNLFQQIRPAPGETDSLDWESQFGYDFLKAILLWLEGGRQSLLAGFKRDPTHRRNPTRFPIPDSADESAIETILIPYLQERAGDATVVNVDANRFEHDSNRILFNSQHAALAAFGNAVRLPLEDLENTAARTDSGDETPDPSNVCALNRGAATRFWALKVGRGILMEVGTGVNYEFVNRAFGGLRVTVEDDSDREMALERSQDDAEANLEEEPIRDINLVMSGSSGRGHGGEPELETAFSSASGDGDGDGDASEESFFEGDGVGLADWPGLDLLHDDGDEDEDDDNEGDSSDEGGHMSDDDSDGDSEPEERTFRRCGVRRRRKEDVELDVPCSSHTRVYRGHCNVKTVKDVNFFGLNDEYVVSGSDSGHIFIWDRQTSDLVNILAGDSDVVNVIQGKPFLLISYALLLTLHTGHPYEPTIAASGIDNTIKIFSPDRRAQQDAKMGINILDPDNPVNTFGPSVRGVGGLKSCKRMHDSYRIMSQNDVERVGGLNEAYVTVSLPSFSIYTRVSE